jgi:hypothetical protein
MTDSEALEFYDEMLSHYGNLPDPEREPIRFAHYLKMFLYYRGVEKI